MPFKRLPKAEYNARREKVVCFNSNEKYTIGHKCTKLFQIVLAEVGDEELDAEVRDIRWRNQFTCIARTHDSQFIQNCGDI